MIGSGALFGDIMDYIPLTDRELQIIGLVAKGQFDKESASQLGVNVCTIKKSLSKSMYKTKTKNRPHLVAFVLQKGLLK